MDGAPPAPVLCTESSRRFARHADWSRSAAAVLGPHGWRATLCRVRAHTDAPRGRVPTSSC